MMKTKRMTNQHRYELFIRKKEGRFVIDLNVLLKLREQYRYILLWEFFIFYD